MKKKKYIFYRIAKNILRPFFKLVFRYEIKRKSILPKEGKYIICCNHISFADPIFLAFTQKRHISFMAKVELFKNKLFGSVLKGVGAFPVSRGSGDGKGIELAQKVLESGELLGIFLEGTRSKTGELLRPRAGVAMIAYQTGADVIPCCITSSKKRVKPFRKIKITIGECIKNSELGMNSGSPMEFRNASRLIMSKIEEYREEHNKEFNKK